LEINFYGKQKKHQIEWRKDNISIKEWGTQNGREYSHIIPRENWEETLWNGIRDDVKRFLTEKEVQAHTGTHNLLSSWVNCANLYFPVRNEQEFKRLMLGFLQERIDANIHAIENVELEFALNGELSPEKVLGEIGGKRGSGQTSPDVAFLVQYKNERGIVLTESKYTEHNFYKCSARTTEESERRPANPDPSRCLQSANGLDYRTICHQMVWGRKYWDNLKLSEHGKEVLKMCPAATAGYQMFRQQSLAEAIASKSEFDLVVSAVAFDGRNQPLITSNQPSGVKDFQTEWGGLFEGKALFKTWTHQEWVEYVRQNGEEKVSKEWVNYINKRYGY
jgi:hypothetical protein